MKTFNRNQIYYQAAVIGLLGALLLSFLYLFSILLQDYFLTKRFSPIELSNAGSVQSVEQDTHFEKRTFLTLAIAPIISPEASLSKYKRVAEYISEVTGQECRLIVRSRYLDINDLMRIGRADIAFVCTYSYLLGEKDKSMEAFVIPVINGETTYNSFIIVSKQNPAKSLLDLKGKRFGFVDLNSTSGWLYPAVWLYKHGQDPTNFFSEHIITGSHDASVKGVLNNLLDGAAVDRLVYEQFSESERNRLRIIDVSPDYGMPSFCIRPNISEEMRNKLTDAFINADKTETGQKVLAEIGIDKFIIPSGEFYRSVRELADDWEKIQKHKGVF